MALVVIVVVECAEIDGDLQVRIIVIIILIRTVQKVTGKAVDKLAEPTHIGFYSSDF